MGDGFAVAATATASGTSPGVGRWERHHILHHVSVGGGKKSGEISIRRVRFGRGGGIGGGVGKDTTSHPDGDVV